MELCFCSPIRLHDVDRGNYTRTLVDLTSFSGRRPPSNFYRGLVEDYGLNGL